MFHVKQLKIPAIVCSVLCISVLLFNLIPFSSFALTNYIYGVSEGYYIADSSSDIFQYNGAFALDTPTGHVSYTYVSNSISQDYTYTFDSITFYGDDPYGRYVNFYESDEEVKRFTINSGETDIKITFTLGFNDESIYNWLDSSFTFVPTSDPPVDPPDDELTPLLSGYYQFLPTTYTPFDPSYIGVGNTISFTNMTDMYAVFLYGDKLPIDKLSFSLRVNNAIVYLDTYIESPSWVDPILIARTSMPQGTETGSTSLPSDTHFNPPLGSFLYFEVNNDDFELDNNSFNLLSDLLSYSTSPPPISERPIIPEPPPSEWTENPFVTILSLIIDALQVPLFGYFSPWDIFITILGILITIWLLKFIAGG